jgi:TrmH family RNA methyltransferase
MLSKNKIKLIKSLSQKKYRLIEKLFLAEGNKLVTEILNSDFKVELLLSTTDFSDSFGSTLTNVKEVISVMPDDIKKASLLKTPQQVLALCEIPRNNFSFDNLSDDLVLCLDNIQDPGNMGTILRIADWFGIHNICTSKNSVDVYNPKVIQASMGAILRVKVFYLDLEELIKKANRAKLPTFGAFLSGKNIYSEKLPEKGLIVLGNEGQGISTGLESLIQNKIHIPEYNVIAGRGSESLNVSVATSIICSEFRREKLITAIQN